MERIELLRSINLVEETKTASATRVYVAVVAEDEKDVTKFCEYDEAFKQLKEITKFEGKFESLETHRVLGEPEKTLLCLAGVGRSDAASSAESAIESYNFMGGQVGKKIVVPENPEHLVVHFTSKNICIAKKTAFLHKLLFTLLRSQARIELPSNSLFSTGHPPKEDFKLTKLTIVSEGDDEGMSKAIFNTARVLAEATVSVALLVDAPPNVANCQFIAETVKSMAEKAGMRVDCSILNETACAELGMGAFLAVAQGSKFGCRLIHLTYKGPSSDDKKCRKIVLVGKGITMDTGGYNLKTNASINFMKCDMAGGATMLFTLLAIAQLEIDDVEVHAIGAFCENMIDKDAYRPGDYIKAMNGKTIEIINTDAEGRLALCDALVYAQKKALKDDFENATIIDAATLTGAAIVALGSEVGAVMSNTDTLSKELQSSATHAGEPLWQLPLRKAYFKKVKGKQTDLMNSLLGAPQAGTITAGLFLNEFVDPNVKWAPIDLAGPAWNDSDREATGYGVATLVEFIAGNAERA